MRRCSHTGESIFDSIRSRTEAKSRGSRCNFAKGGLPRSCLLSSSTQPHSDTYRSLIRLRSHSSEALSSSSPRAACRVVASIKPTHQAHTEHWPPAPTALSRFSSHRLLNRTFIRNSDVYNITRLVRPPASFPEPEKRVVTGQKILF